MSNDIFVMGAGVGALISGALLATEGHSVKILENLPNYDVELHASSNSRYGELFL